MKDFLNLKEFLDSNTRKIEEKEMMKEIIFRNILETWYKDMVKVGNKKNNPVKDLIKELENFEEYERKFPAQHQSTFKPKKNMCNKKGHSHYWNDYPENCRNKVKRRN